MASPSGGLPGALEPQPGGMNGHSSVNAAGGVDEQTVNPHTVSAHHQEGANTGNMNSFEADDLSVNLKGQQMQMKLRS